MAEKHSTVKARKFIVQGGLYGLMAAVSGSVIFGIIQPIILLIRSTSPLEVSIFLLFLIFILGSILLAVVPATIGGGLLAIILRRDFRNGKLSGRQAILKGIVLGVVAALGICLLVGAALYAWMWSAGLGSTAGYFFFSAEALVMGAIAGGWVGRQLARHLAR